MDEKLAIDGGEPTVKDALPVWPVHGRDQRSVHVSGRRGCCLVAYGTGAGCAWGLRQR